MGQNVSINDDVYKINSVLNDGGGVVVAVVAGKGVERGGGVRGRGACCRPVHRDLLVLLAKVWRGREGMKKKSLRSGESIWRVEERPCWNNSSLGQLVTVVTCLNHVRVFHFPVSRPQPAEQRLES